MIIDHISQSSQVSGPLFQNAFIWSCLCLCHCSLVDQFMLPRQMSQRSQVSGSALSGCFFNCLCCCLMSMSLGLSFFPIPTSQCHNSCSKLLLYHQCNLFHHFHILDASFTYIFISGKNLYFSLEQIVFIRQERDTSSV